MDGQAKILLIDDDRDFVNATKTVLESNNYYVIVANNGNEGLKKAKEENPDLIILDIIMPVRDGFSASEALKKDPSLSRIPVLILTSFSQRKGETTISVSRGMNLEAEDYLEKPIMPKDLLKTVEKLLKPKNEHK